MSGEIGFKSKFINIVPSLPASVPNNTLFIDSSNSNQATFKDGSGNVGVIGAVSASNIFIKQMQSSVVLAVNTPVAKLANGKIINADSDTVNGQVYIGITMGTAVVDGLVSVLLVGANIAGALTGLGYTPGQEIFLGENGGFTNNVSTFTDGDDSIIRVGIADCTSGNASGTVTDLIAFTEVVARP